MKNKKSIIISAASVLLICILVYSIISIFNYCTAKKLAAFGEEQFYANDYGNYMEGICSTEIDDISASFVFSYNYKTDYKKDIKTLFLYCTANNFTSKIIDDYYTQNDTDGNGLKLYKNMSTIDEKRGTYKYTYAMDNTKTVVVVIQNGGALSIESPDGHTYLYDCITDYHTGVPDLISVKVDGEYVYYYTRPSEKTENSNNSTSSGSSSARHTESESWACAKNIVKNNLKAPSSAKFCSISEAKIKHIGNGQYSVSGWVEAQNSYGAVVRQSFTVNYTATSSGYKNASVSFR